MKITLGTRGSDLALRQADMVRAALEAAHPGLRCAVEIIKTSGDARPDLPLAEFSTAKVVDKGIFTKELEIALAERRVDVAVHSLKDVPTEISPEFAITSVLPREDTLDVLLSRAPLPNGWRDLPPAAKVATGAVRRQAQLLWLRPDLELRDIRGNVPTRMAKLLAGDLDAIMLAAAGLKRLGYLAEGGRSLRFEGQEIFLAPLGPPDFLPACGQGAIGLEIRAADAQARKLVDAINHPATMERISLERAFLLRLQAGCHTPVGVITAIEGAEIAVHARLFDEHRPNDPPKEAQARGPLGQANALADELMRALG